jgi:hypothetical protein
VWKAADGNAFLKQLLIDEDDDPGNGELSCHVYSFVGPDVPRRFMPL